MPEAPSLLLYVLRACRPRLLGVPCCAPAVQYSCTAGPVGWIAITMLLYSMVVAADCCIIVVFGMLKGKLVEVWAGNAAQAQAGCNGTVNSRQAALRRL